MYCSVLVLCCVAIKLVATALVCLHDVSLMYLCMESAHGVEGGALGQRTWHTWCPHFINRYKMCTVCYYIGTLIGSTRAYSDEDVAELSLRRSPRVGGPSPDARTPVPLVRGAYRV
jgi:hypothetical protein